MKLIIEIDKDLYESIAGKNSDQVEPRQVVISFQATIADAIAEGKPYNPTGDCISREALKDFTYINKGNFNTVEGIREWIDKAPTVEIDERTVKDAYDQGYVKGLEDAQPEQAGWIGIKTSCDIGHKFYFCSKCHREVDLLEGESLKDYPFCHCGAKMFNSEGANNG